MTAPNPNSILDSVKQAIGLPPDNQAFDLDVTMFVNAAFGALQQLGVGSDAGFWISDNTTLWSQYVDTLSYLGMVQTFIFMKAKLAFDPPQNSFGIDAIKEQIAELGWRINVAVEAVAGEENVVPTYVPNTVTLQFASTVTFSTDSANVFYLTLDGDCTINAPVNGVNGQHITLELVSNGHVVTWGHGWNFGSAGEPELTPDGKEDIISAVYRQSVAEWRAGFSPGF